MTGRVVTLLRDKDARAYFAGRWVFAGHEDGTGVRVSIGLDDWERLCQQSGTLERAIAQLEHMAALEPLPPQDPYGGYSIAIRSAA